jgi:hypothetical protein
MNRKICTKYCRYSRDEDNGGDSDGGVHSRQSTKRASGRDDSGGDGDGGRNSDSDGNGDGDSEDKDGDANVKGFFGWHRRLFSVRVVRFFGVSTICCFWRGSYNFSCLGGFANKKEKVVHTNLFGTTYVEKTRPKTPSTSCFLGRMFWFLSTYVRFPL